jgi:maltooligosyltrehalose trehalohydrolase
MVEPYGRRFPIGAELTTRKTVHFRVWAPRRRQVEVVLYNSTGRELGSHPLTSEKDGHFSGEVTGRAGTFYRFQLDGAADSRFPDPASRFQPNGPHGPSQVIDPAQFRWSDTTWAGIKLEGQVLYELHVGTFTPAGTWTAAAEGLPALAEVGITTVEVMPVADFPGRFGWGYDGVDLFAPTRLYGPPDDFRRFVDRAHALGMGVVLDVVYNHFGPSGNYLMQFSDHYVTDRYRNEWGAAIDFDGPHAGPVREFFVTNAEYWIEEYHLDGLRFDATQQMFDTSPRHILAEIAERVRAAARRQGREALLIAENEPQETRLVRPAAGGGYELDAIWNDDFHHAVIVALGSRREAYYTDYQGRPQELVSATKYGFLYQGQRYRWQGKPRGTSSRGLRPAMFVHYLENHDQVANSARGERLHRQTSPTRLRAATALLLLGPATPMLFQGQEFGATAPFLYFADHEPELATLVRRGRTDFLAQFPTVALPTIRDALANPADITTFERCKLDPDERQRHAETYALHCDLLRLRREDPVFSRQGEGGLDGAVLGPEAFVLRYFDDGARDRLLLVNLGGQLDLAVVPEPLLAPPEHAEWMVLWSSEDPRYGGLGIPAVEVDDLGWRIPPACAIALAPRERPPERA